MYPSMNSGTGLFRDAGMFKEEYRDTSLDRGTGLWGGVQVCTVGTGLYRGKGVYMQGGVQGYKPGPGYMQACTGVGGGGGGLGVQDCTKVQACTGVQACTRVMVCTGRGSGLDRGIGLYWGGGGGGGGAGLYKGTGLYRGAGRPV